jgi:catechol 2,3-dioxygenase-like lactoylglutathione lyase family enzyme
MQVYRISAVTLIIKNMERSCSCYSRIPGFRVVYGGTAESSFTTFRVGETDVIMANNTNAVRDRQATSIGKTYLNLELDLNDSLQTIGRDFGRIIFYADDVDALYAYLKSDSLLSKLITLESTPKDAPWGERFFHLRDPDGYELSFAQPTKTKIM